ncbi:MAG: hypothetical protein J7494_03445 [Sphingobium sp.]|nr:hypothetical protein [Sphingobium sp.]
MLALLAGCSAKRGDISSSGMGIIQYRSACPIVAVPAYTGDVTLFDPPASRTSESIDVAASISNLKSTCEERGGQIVSNATFMVTAIRRDPGAQRVIDLPYFSTVVQGGTQVVAKRIGTVRLYFPEGALRSQAFATAASTVDKAAATLPSDIEQLINKPRKSGDFDASLDPLSQPRVKEAVQRTSFELLVGFNLTQDQLRYNITR